MKTDNTKAVHSSENDKHYKKYVYINPDKSQLLTKDFKAAIEMPAAFRKY